MEQESEYNCTSYRKEMILLALRRSLTEEKLTERERRKIIRQIRKLEALLAMD
jgi:hypothetical protein